MYTLFVSALGLVAVSQKSPALLVIYGCFLFLAFLTLCAGVFLAVSVVVIVEKEVEHTELTDRIRDYGHVDAATKEIDLIQCEMTCAPGKMC